MKKNKVFDFLFRKQYVIAGVIVLSAAFGMTALYSHNQEIERERLEQELAENMEESNEAAEEIQIENVTSVIPPKEETELTDETVSVSDESAQGDEASQEEITDVAVIEEPSEEIAEDVALEVSGLHFPLEEGMLWPLEGNVIMNYSMDSTIYHATLDQYKYNPGIVIAGEVNSKVYSAAKGQITAIEQNEVTGTTVTVDLGDGYQAIYGQLKELNFKEGDYVESGHVLGYVSEPTKYYSVEGSNLYFELQKDGVPVDPIEFFE